VLAEVICSLGSTASILTASLLTKKKDVNTGLSEDSQEFRNNSARYLLVRTRQSLAG
jgi:hypothetical protein